MYIYIYIQEFICTCKYRHNMLPKVGLFEETKGGGKEEKNNKQ
jgi:hypothetical protein